MAEIESSDQKILKLRTFYFSLFVWLEHFNLHAHYSKHRSFYILASGGWQEPENPHTQRVCLKQDLLLFN